MKQAEERKKRVRSSKCNHFSFIKKYETLQYSPKNNPRVIIIQKLYGKFFNDEEKLDFPKHRFKKFIKDIVFGTIERDEILTRRIR